MVLRRTESGYKVGMRWIEGGYKVDISTSNKPAVRLLRRKDKALDS
jgi:hypothetical protein